MKVRKLILAAASAALALGTLAVPASANGADYATVFVAHGIPGAVVDVCVGGDEVRSNFKYGRKFKLFPVPEGESRIRVFLADKRTCKGTKVIDEDVLLQGGRNYTAVAWLKKGQPALKIFETDIGLAPGNASVTVRHVAKAPAVHVYLARALSPAGADPGPFGPTIANLTRGSSAGPLEVAPAVYAWWVALLGDPMPVIGPDTGPLYPEGAYQILAVGTKAQNYRFIVIAQPGSPKELCTAC
jgi:hypothetical protein